MKANLFQGRLVRLTAENPETLAKASAFWDRDSEFRRLLDDEPPILWSKQKIKEWIEKELDEDGPEEFFFGLRTLKNNHLIGFVSLFEIDWTNGDSLVGIGLGDRDYWGQGYGSDAMDLILRYAFEELNLYRVSLVVFEYNERAIRVYEKVGFRIEGHGRGRLLREGRRWDLIHMGILREEWQIARSE